MLHFLYAAISLSPNSIGLPTSTPDLGAAMANAVKLLMGLIGSLSIIFVVVGGIQIATGGGNPARLKQGRETVLLALTGLGIAMAAYGIVTFVVSYL